MWSVSSGSSGRGACAGPLSSICAQAISHGALFRHFPSREALWEEAVRWATAGLAADFASVDRADQPPLAKVEGLLLCHAEFHLRHRGLLQMLFAELQRPGTNPARQRGQRFLSGFQDRLA